jgi:hypothetical protein
VSGFAVRALGVVTGWGRGIEALSAARPAASPAVLAVQPSVRTGERLRRATRECLLAVDAVDALLEDGGLSREDIAGPGTALVYVTAAAYGASNRAFIGGGGGALHFPYTAPSAVPAEVAIEFGLHGPYAVLIGGATATIDAMEHARVLLSRGACARALVLAVETFQECADVLARGGVGCDAPLVEAAVAALLVRADAAERGEALERAAPAESAARERVAPPEPAARERAAPAEPAAPERAVPEAPAARERAAPPEPAPPESAAPESAAPERAAPEAPGAREFNDTLACAPLIALASARARGERRIDLRGAWRGREATTTVGVQGPAHPGWREG